MKTITFDENKAKEIEQIVCGVFGFYPLDIVRIKDTFSKKVVVFLLFKYFGFDKRNIGRAYQMTYLYVPTVVAEMESMYDRECEFEFKIDCVLKKMGYEEKICSSQ